MYPSSGLDIVELGGENQEEQGWCCRELHTYLLVGCVAVSESTLMLK